MRNKRQHILRNVDKIRNSRTMEREREREREGERDYRRLQRFYQE